MRDSLKEIWTTLSHNKLRTSLTGFAVAWGIFMLIALLGAGNGLLHALLSNMSEVETNSMEVWPGRMTKSYGGLKEGTWLSFDMKDVELLRSAAFSDVIDIVSPQTSTSATVTCGMEHVSSNINGFTSERKTIDNIRMEYGRFINQDDEKERSKVLVVGSRMAINLLGGDETNYRRIIGRNVIVNGLSFKVVGIFHTDESYDFNDSYAPFEVVRMLRGGDDHIDGITFTFHGIRTEKQNDRFEARLKKAIAVTHFAAPDDSGVAYVWSRFTNNMQMNKAMRYVRIALWILGIFTLVSGIVGVSNIMLISVKERTHEFGIRKAIGAKPWGILKLIIGESVAITALFGYVGMVCGLLACQIMDKTLASKPTDLGFIQMYIFKDPSVGLDVAMEATLLLIVAGTIAGLVPAWKASKVKPIEALRDE